MRLNEDETDHLFERIPPHEEYVGLPFVTYLTRTNVVCHIIKLLEKFPLSCDIEADEAGLAGVRLRVRGTVTTYEYKAATDGHIVLGVEGLQDFLYGKNLQVGQAVVVTIKNTARPNLRMMIVIDIISSMWAWPSV